MKIVFFCSNLLIKLTFILLFYVSSIVSFDTGRCSLNGEGVWAVGMVTGTSIFNLTSPYDQIHGESCSRNPIITCIDVTDIPAAFVADPFLYVEDNIASNPWYAFFEVKNMNPDPSLNRRRGQIGVAISNNLGKTWTYKEIVVSSEKHLSYPFVFKYKDEYYMMPQGQSISYWKAESFPLKWKFLFTAHRRILNDATMIFYQGLWWLFALHEPNSNRDHWFLHILYSDSPLGPWNDTPNNCGVNPANRSIVVCMNENVTTPHRRGRNGVRPGGHLFIENNRLYRMVQNSQVLYGDSMDLYEITHLSTTDILEDVLVEEFRGSFRNEINTQSWNNLRYHHLDLHYLKFHHRHLWVGLFDGDYNNGRNVRARNISRCSDFEQTSK